MLYVKFYYLAVDEVMCLKGGAGLVARDYTPCSSPTADWQLTSPIATARPNAEGGPWFWRVQSRHDVAGSPNALKWMNPGNPSELR